MFANTCDLKLSPNNRFLVHDDGTPFFPTGDTCWEIPWDLDRAEVETYLQTRKDQKFNMVGINSFDWSLNNYANQYGDQPFVIVSGKYDPLQPITTPGNNPGNSTEYDYWDNLEYIIDSAAAKGIYVVLLPTWGWSRVIGGSDYRIFTEISAYTYGQWIGNRFSDKTNIIWMMGGDCIPDQYTDYKPTFRNAWGDNEFAYMFNSPVLGEYGTGSYNSVGMTGVLLYDSPNPNTTSIVMHIDFDVAETRHSPRKSPPAYAGSETLLGKEIRRKFLASLFKR